MMAHQDDDDYLWAGVGTPDAEIQRLEHLLQRFRHQPESVPGAAGAEPAADVETEPE